MSDPLKKLTRGQQLRDLIRNGEGPFNADWYNMTVDTIKDVKRLKQILNAEPIQVPRDRDIWLANISWTDLDQYAVSGIGDLANKSDETDDGEQLFRDQTNFYSAPPVNGEPFAVTIDPIPIGERYLCLTGNTGDRPPSPKWLFIIGTPTVWAAGTYTRGLIVTHDNELYVNTEETTTGTPGISGDWQLVYDLGPYIDGMTVVAGDMVVIPNLGRIVLSGVAKARVFVNNLTDRLANAIDDNYSRLFSESEGPAGAEILWPRPFTTYGEQWAEIRLCCCGESETPPGSDTGSGISAGICGPCLTTAMAYCFNLSGVADNDCIQCDLLNKRIELNLFSSCRWRSDLIEICPIGQPVYSETIYTFFELELSGVTWYLRGGSGVVYSASAASWNCVDPLTMTRLLPAGSGPDASGFCQNWPATITVQPCSASGVTVDYSDEDLCDDASSITITGTGFDPIAANNTIVFNRGAIGVCVSVTGTTSMLVQFTTNPTPPAGHLTAEITNGNGASFPAVQVATTITSDAPTVTASSANLANTAPTITINGTNFDPTPANNIVTFNLSAVGVCTSGTSTTQLVVTFSSQPTNGDLLATVTTPCGGASSSTNVATVVNP